MDLPSKQATQILETDLLWKTDHRGSNPRLVPTALLRSAVFKGQRDLHLAVAGAPKGVAAPTDTAFGPTGTNKQPKFAVNDLVYLAVHFDQDIKQGTTVFPHVHWSSDGTNVNTVKWELSYFGAPIAGAFPADTVLPLEDTPSGTAWTHYIVSDPTGFAAPDKHSTLFMTLKRVTNGGTDNTDAIYGLFVDIMHESDQYGNIDGLP